MTTQGKEHSAMKICKHAFCDKREKKNNGTGNYGTEPGGIKRIRCNRIVEPTHSGHSKLRAYQHDVQSCRVTMLDKHRVHGHKMQKMRLKEHVLTRIKYRRFLAYLIDF